MNEQMRVALLMMMDGQQFVEVAKEIEHLVFHKHEELTENQEYMPINDDEFLNAICQGLLEDYEQIKQVAKKAVQLHTFSIGDPKKMIEIMEQSFFETDTVDSFKKMKKMFAFFLFVLNKSKEYPLHVHFIMIVPLIFHYMQLHVEHRVFIS